MAVEDLRRYVLWLLEGLVTTKWLKGATWQLLLSGSIADSQWQALVLYKQLVGP